MKRKRHNQQTWSEAGTEVPDVDNSPLIHEEHNNLCLSLGDGIVEDKLKSIKQWFGRKIKPRELEKIGDFCDLYECLYDRGIIDLGEYKELSKALNAVGLQRLDKEIKKTSETIRKIRIKKRNSSGSKRKGSVQKANVKRDWKSARRKWDRIGAELLDRRANKLLKRNFEEMGIFFYGMDKVMNSKDVDVKLNICSRVTGGVNKILDKIFTDTALTNARDLKKATCVFVDNYGASVIIAARGCLRLTLRFTTRSALEMMWDDYLSGDLSNMLTDDIVTIPMKEMAGWEEIFVGVKIDKAQYLNVCRSLPNGINRK
ncbi:uncharacterized protein LOC106174367 [Lingula anatina]|uniref:Uncharacterized protein LOC106174367 n=1 Tax=Lingula anatina TaxID=7574 RepID=A0A1S3JLV2_LINAN|nr:uncharacterized protein LOC106174367 [Lingula anatina]|eukprot:XP_013411363.1 uncharacterized protein LOC106174367 [Lingula anatina]